MDNSLLVPHDFSSCSERAADEAGQLASHLQAKVILLYVHQLEHVRPEFQSGEVTFEETQEEHKKLTAVAERLRNANEGITVETSVQIGSPEKTILEEAGRQGVRMIVLGTHGRSGLKHLVLGSVAERIVRMAPVPVLVTKEAAFIEQS